MVCIALVMGIAARDAAGKIMALWFPVVVFVLSGYEHCVANSKLIHPRLKLGFLIPISLSDILLPGPYVRRPLYHRQAVV